MMERLVVLGGAESGIGSAVLGKVKGYEVFLSDSGKMKDVYRSELDKWAVPYEEGGHTDSLVLNADLVVKSPGIPCDAPMVKRLEQKGVPILSEIEFAGRYDNARKICITGSNGKTTTTSLIYHILKEAGLNVGLGGNIGKSYAYQVATEHYDWYVLEISSFQLDNVYDFRPDAAILMNITPDHLDRYDHKMENYAMAKFRITRNLRPEDVFIFDKDDENTAFYMAGISLDATLLPFSQNTEAEGAFLRDGNVIARYKGEELSIPVCELSLQGRHNVYNCMAAALAAKAAGASNEVISHSLMTFSPIEHRLEPVRTVDGVLYINDSKATNVDSAWYALECQTRKVVWIVGGKDKGNDYSVLEGFAKQKVRAIVCLGVDNTKIHAAFENIVGKDNIVDTLSAVQAARESARLAHKGDVVLLSPCCASFDLFRSYEDRGEQFKNAVNDL